MAIDGLKTRYGSGHRLFRRGRIVGFVLFAPSSLATLYASASIIAVCHLDIQHRARLAKLNADVH